MKRITKGIIAIILLASIAIGSYYLIQVYLPYRAEQQRILEQEQKELVKTYQDISYPNKSLGQVSLSHYNAEEIADLLRKELSPYQKSIATIQINDDTLTYSMKDLGQRIFYRCSDKKEFEAGEEQKLAEYIVSMDKDRSLSEQYDIIQGDIDAMPLEVSIQCECDEKALTKVIQNLSMTYDKPVQNSRINKKYKILPAKAGSVLDTEEIAKGLRTYLNRQTTNDYSAAYETSKVEPEWYPEDLKKVNSLVARYTTKFTNNTARGYNIRLAAARLNGICLLPGESVSFLDTLYDKSDKKSYKKSAAYFKGKVVQAEGGGICQVSTTAYHTFLLTGIIPKKRYPHSMPVGYAKLGLDAALSVGGKDLVIKNTLDSPLLILAEAKNGTLAVAIQSYSNALKGYTYKPRAKKISDLEAESFLDVYKGKKKEKTIALSHDTYQKKSS